MQTENLQIDQGADYTFEMLLRAPVVSPAIEGEPIDLSTHVFKGQVRNTVTSEAVLAVFEFVILDQTSTATKGRVRVTLTASASRSLPVRKQTRPDRSPVYFAYDIQSTVIGGNTERWLSGQIEMIPGVIRG